MSDDFIDFDPSTDGFSEDNKQVDLSQQVIENYQKDEAMMVLIFSQWCVNHDLDALELYKRAYPSQAENKLLKEKYEEAKEAGKSDLVDDSTVFTVLELFGNTDLAFEVQAVIEARED